MNKAQSQTQESRDINNAFRHYSSLLQKQDLKSNYQNQMQLNKHRQQQQRQQEINDELERINLAK